MVRDRPGLSRSVNDVIEGDVVAGEVAPAGRGDRPAIEEVTMTPIVVVAMWVAHRCRSSNNEDQTNRKTVDDKSKQRHAYIKWGFSRVLYGDLLSSIMQFKNCIRQPVNFKGQGP